MQLQDIIILYDYNAWAKERMLSVVEHLTPEQFTKDLGSSHGGVHGTLAHALGAEEIWLKRWRGDVITGFLKPSEVATFQELRSRWKSITEKTSAFCKSLRNDEDVRRIVVYKDLKGNECRQPLEQLMAHLVNHSTYHRGQIVTMLRQLGVRPVDTDLVIYFRQQSR